MTPLRAVAALRELRAQPLWRLLAADKAVLTLSLLEHVLLSTDKVLPASSLYERLGRAIHELRAAGEDLPQTAHAYVAQWVAEGWLVRRLGPDAREEQLELSADATAAVRFVSSLRSRRTLATESRLSMLQRLVLELAEKTDEDPETRVDALLAERDRLDREVEAVRGGLVRALPDERALERAREVIALTDELTADFRRVRDDFDELNRGLRQSLVEHEGSRGEVLEALFAGVDVIAESEAGRTFSAFWRLLTDPEQSEALREALELVVRRPFAKRLEARERKFLLSMTHVLGEEGSRVHDVLQSFARSLKSFVQSREFQEQRRLTTLLKRATQAALSARAAVRANEDIGYELTLTSSRVRSASQWSLYDPRERMADAEMRDAEPTTLDLEWVGELVRQSEIDFRGLRRHLRELLVERARVSIGEALERFPAEQGLGSVVGYVALGVKHGEVTGGLETVRWVGKDARPRRARVPVIYFARERCRELAD